MLNLTPRGVMPTADGILMFSAPLSTRNPPFPSERGLERLLRARGLLEKAMVERARVARVLRFVNVMGGGDGIPGPTNRICGNPRGVSEGGPGSVSERYNATGDSGLGPNSEDPVESATEFRVPMVVAVTTCLAVVRFLTVARVLHMEVVIGQATVAGVLLLETVTKHMVAGRLVYIRL